MTRKKETSSLLSAEDTTQVQHLLEQYHEMAQHLHETTSQTQVEMVLSELNTLPEQVQFAFLKALSKEHTIDAADILTAANLLSPGKEIRKEARRSLIRLEAVKVYPHWNPPIAQTPAVQVNVAHPPRFWKGFATQTREEGEIQLCLYWEQGYDYSEIRSVLLLLDFWDVGIKEFETETVSRRRAEEYINDFRAKLGTTPLIACTLAEGKRLIEEALSTNEWHHASLPRDFRNNLPLLNKLILQASDIGEDRGLTFIIPDLTEQEVVINFVGAWSMGDYGLAYDLFTENSSIREGLPREEWIARRRAWANEAHPARLELGFVYEREARQSTLWLPASSFSSGLSARKDVEIGWSLELSATPLSGTLKEMPMGTTLNKETGRHWFWNTYTLVREHDVWHIQTITDEGAAAQGLSINELQNRIKEQVEIVRKTMKENDSPTHEVMAELSWRLTQALHYYDALIVRLPFDRKLYEEAYTHAMTMGIAERGLAYVEHIRDRFAENRVDILRSIAAIQASIAHKYSAQEMKARQERMLTLAEANFREALTLDHSGLGHVLLAELLLNMGRSEEAEAELLQAQSLNPNSQTQTAIEAGLGNIAMRRERFADATIHYQRVTELSPHYPSIWFNLGFTQRQQGHLAEAQLCYTRAIEEEPADPRPYSELAALYMSDSDPQRARELLEQGIRNIPESAHLHALLASVLFEMGNLAGAQRHLKEAEAIEPKLEIVETVRQYINTPKRK